MCSDLKIQQYKVSAKVKRHLVMKVCNFFIIMLQSSLAMLQTITNPNDHIIIMHKYDTGWRLMKLFGFNYLKYSPISIISKGSPESGYMLKRCRVIYRNCLSISCKVRNQVTPKTRAK
uniref:Uncharacterized protein n=1 Tax=Glossina palpalis gambiensis TaxID=67801 RepID=A0A1B0AXF4_9MUSC